MADHVLFFEVKALFGSWKFPLEYHASSGCVVAEKLQELLNSVLAFCFSVGFDVIAIASDQGKPNQKLFKLLGVTADKPLFLFGNTFFQLDL